MTRLCRKCGESKEEVNFKLLPDKRNRRRVCFSCEYKQADKNKLRVRNKKWRDKQPGSFDIITRYGITQEDYVYLLKKQNGVCAICGKKNKESSRRKRLSVDHDHASSEMDIRGLLCNLCNAWLGRIEDKPELVLRAWLYLRRFRCQSINMFAILVEESLIKSNELPRKTLIEENVNAVSLEN